jgi:BASS family bile acid:Na+ symporter
MTRMDRTSDVAQLLHGHLLKLIVLSYVLAAVAPSPGLWMKDAEIVGIRSPLGPMTMTLPKLLLSLLLFNAGLRARLARVGGIARRPWMMLVGLATNLAVPFLFLASMAPALGA